MIDVRLRPSWLIGLALVAGCRASSPDLAPRVGLRAVDRDVPAGVETFDAPAWTAGDELRYRRGGRLELTSVVQPAGENRLALVDTQGRRELVFDAELQRLGERPAGSETFELEVDPFDPAFSWPLWEGKRWTGEFVLRPRSGNPVPIVARYHCDAVEQVTVPAGTFRCLRIWRRDTVDGEGEFFERVSIDWYAPELGHLVRRIEDGLETVLVEALVQ